MHRFSRALRTTAATALTVFGLFGASVAAAAPIKSISIIPENPQAGGVTRHNYTFTLPTGSNLRQIRMQYRIAPASPTVPTGLGTTSATLAALTLTGFAADFANWSIDNTTPGLLILTRASTATSVSTNAVVTASIGAITNNNMDPGAGNCDNVTGTESCFVSITAYSDTGSTETDKANATYTIVGGQGTQVTATVEPIIRFTVTGTTPANMAAITTNDANAAGAGEASTGQVVSTTATAIPFGSTIAGINKFAQHRLNVETNAYNGYAVYVKFMGAVSTTAMAGTANSTNVINPYTNSSSYGSPTAWTGAPTGTVANTNSGWIGLRTTDADVSGGAFASSDVYAGPVVSDSATGNAYMSSSTSDNGLTPAFVTWKFGTNSLQNADTYVGTMVYTAVPTY